MNTPISFEFFPPKYENGKINLLNCITEFKKTNPEYMSVTFGAGGSTQSGTLDTVLEIQKQKITVAPHLSCVGSSKSEIKSILDEYKSNDINQIVALRGDLPSGNCDIGEMKNANDLVSFIRENFDDYFAIKVAAYPEAHPQAKNFYEDFKFFKQKVMAGADSAITQYFYNIDSYKYFIDDCAKNNIDIPIVPGIMPITNYVQLSRFSNMCGADIPRWISSRLESYGDDMASIVDFGIDVVSQLCQDLIDIQAPSLHFYSMNKVEPNLQIIKNISS